MFAIEFVKVRSDMAMNAVGCIASPSRKMQTGGSNFSATAASTENIGSPAAPAEPTQVNYYDIGTIVKAKLMFTFSLGSRANI